MRLAEYIWIDGQEPVGRLRSKTRVVENDEPPVWGFDGSSTKQADGDSSDCVLKPVKIVQDPLRRRGDMLVLCEVYNSDGSPGKNNWRTKTKQIYNETKGKKPIFGIEQEYTMFDGHAPLGWPRGGYAPKQGPFYCGVGADEAFGTEIAEEHMMACLDAGLAWCGKNGEVMCGQWEFQIGPKDPLTVADDIWLARYLLFKIAEKYGVSVKLDPKPHPDLNGAGMHTNFSTCDMRQNYDDCVKAARDLGFYVTGADADFLVEGNVYNTDGFPKEYGTKYQLRLTGEHETCSWREFKYGASDRTASVRIPLHVKNKKRGYIEDRRPCADADPYRIVSYIMEVCCA